MAGIEWQWPTPGEFIREIEDAVKQHRESKYAFQVGIRELAFTIDEDRAKALGVTLPCQSIDQAEHALRGRVIQPATFLEDDGTGHRVVVFDLQPVGSSGFIGCVTHSLALTDRGLFELGRYPAMDLASLDHYWQWFLHRRLATPEQVATWQGDHHLSPTRVVDCVFEALTGRPRRA
jgi:hypothetical protein